MFRWDSGHTPHAYKRTDNRYSSLNSIRFCSMKITLEIRTVVKRLLKWMNFILFQVQAGWQTQDFNYFCTLLVGWTNLGHVIATRKNDKRQQAALIPQIPVEFQSFFLFASQTICLALHFSLCSYVPSSNFSLHDSFRSPSFTTFSSVQFNSIKFSSKYLFNFDVSSNPIYISDFR